MGKLADKLFDAWENSDFTDEQGWPTGTTMVIAMILTLLVLIMLPVLIGPTK